MSTMHRFTRVLKAALAAFCLALVLAAPTQAQQTQGPPTARIVSGPEVGETAPDFTLPWASRDSAGPADAPFRLAHQRGKVVVLAFYPQDFTSGCTAEFQAFARQYETMFGPDVVLVGISVDDLDTHVRFARSLELPFRLLSDPGQEVARRYGSQGTGATMRRTVYVIDRDGIVRYRNLRFGALDTRAYDDLKAAIREVRGR